MRIGAPGFLPYRALFFARRQCNNGIKWRVANGPALSCENRCSSDRGWRLDRPTVDDVSKYQMKLKHLLSASAAILLVGCSVTPQPRVEKEIESPQVNLAGYPPPFREGYLDGCNSARQKTSTIKDEERYKNDSMYAAGWRDGFDICSGKQYE